MQAVWDAKVEKAKARTLARLNVDADKYKVEVDGGGEVKIVANWETVGTLQ